MNKGETSLKRVKAVGINERERRFREEVSIQKIDGRLSFGVKVIN